MVIVDSQCSQQRTLPPSLLRLTLSTLAARLQFHLEKLYRTSAAVASAGVEWDAVELPSQFMEVRQGLGLVSSDRRTLAF